MAGAKSSPIQTEFDFELPKGYLDSNGVLHRSGRMRLATGLDEIVPMRDPRVKSNQSYLMIVILSRVITKLGELPEVSTEVVENMFTTDLAYLQDLYRQINSEGSKEITAVCPKCNHVFKTEGIEPGGL